MLSLIQQTQQGSASTLDRSVADNMVLQSFDLGLSCGSDNLPPYVGDYAPSGANTFYTDLDSTIYSQGKEKNEQNKTNSQNSILNDTESGDPFQTQSNTNKLCKFHWKHVIIKWLFELRGENSIEKKRKKLFSNSPISSLLIYSIRFEQDQWVQMAPLSFHNTNSKAPMCA